MFELFTGLGLAMPAGLNAYIPLLAIALADRYFGLIHLSEPYSALSSPVAILVIGILLLIELLADKIPIIDHVNDLINSVIRPAAGAILVMAATDTVSYINPVFAMILGLLVAGGVHAVKATIRPTVTASTAGLGNPVVSACEDGIAIGLVILALVAPFVIAGVVAALSVLFILVIRWRRQRSRTLAHVHP